VLATILWVASALALACRSHDELVLENLALRRQLRALTRTRKRPRVRSRDRLFWVVLAKTWRHWRTALVLIGRQTPSCDGIASDFGADGRGVRFIVR
jgi:hypothetical protein